MDLDHLTKYWITTTLTKHLRLVQVPLKYAAQQRHVHDRTDILWIDSTEWGPCSTLLNGVIIDIIVIPGYDIPLTSDKWFFMHYKYFTTKHLPCHYLPNTAPTTQRQLSSNSSWFDRLLRKTYVERAVAFREGNFEYVYIINFQIWTQVTLPDISLLNSPIHHLGRARLLTRILRFPGLHTKQWVARAFWQENPASLRESWRLCSTRAHESGSRVDSWNPKRNDWMLHCWTVFLLQGQRLHLHYFQGTGGPWKGEKDAWGLMIYMARGSQF